MPADTIASASSLEPAARTWRSRLQSIRSGPLVLALRLAVSAAIIAVIFRHIDVAALAAQVAGQSPWWLGVAAAIGIVQIGLLGLRWQQVLAGLGAGIGAGTALAVTYMGTFFNAWLLGPAGGDVARAMLAPARAVGRMGIVHSVLFDRAATLAGMGLIVAPLAAFNVGPFARGWPLLLALALVPAPFVGMAVIGWVVRAFAGCCGAVYGRLRDLDRDWRRLCRDRRHFAGAIAAAALGQLVIAAEAWSLAQAQHLDIALLDLLMLMPPVLLVSALPVSAGGWGVREGAMVAALGAAGIASGAALLLSVELGLVVMLVSLPGGAIWLRRWHARTPAAAAAAR